METHLDREIRLSEESQYETLYSWSLQEFNEEGKRIKSDQVPWDWDLYFFASELRLNQSIDIDGIVKPNETDDAEEAVRQAFTNRLPRSDVEPVRESETISGTLHSGRCRDGESLEDDTSYSMFGTERRFMQFDLEIRKLEEGDDRDRCNLWGCVSHTSEVDFRDETQDDTVVVHLWLAQKRFNKLVEIIEARRADIVEVRLGGVSGFYSEWSPSIRTNSIKVLTLNYQEIIRPDNCKIDPPRLGEVHEFNIRIVQRNSINPKQALSGINLDKLFEESDDYGEDDHEQKQEVIESQPGVSGQLLAQLARNELTLSKLRIPLWLIFVALLFLLFTLVF